MTYLLWEGLESSASDRSVHFKPYYRFYHGYNIFPSLIIIVIFIIIILVVFVVTISHIPLPSLLHWEIHDTGKLGFASTLLEFHETRVAAFTKLARNIDILSILKHDPLERCPPFCRDNMTLLTDIRAEVHKGIKLWLRTLLLSNWHQNYEYALDIIDFASVKALPSNSLNQVEA